jgi:hypothetical protein
MVDRSPGLFDFDERLAELTAKGDDLADSGRSRPQFRDDCAPL